MLSAIHPPTQNMTSQKQVLINHICCEFVILRLRDKVWAKGPAPIVNLTLLGFRPTESYVSGHVPYSMAATRQ